VIGGLDSNASFGLTSERNAYPQAGPG
jgi:hypothetical protein